MDQRMSKDKYYLNIADAVLDRSTCLRRKYGAIIGAPRGRVNCSELGYCNREQLRIPSGQRYELCRSVHAEANAIISAARRDMIGGTLYLVGRDAASGELLHDTTSCAMCRRMIINSGITRVVNRIGDDGIEIIDVQNWIVNDESIQPKAEAE